MMKPSQHNEKDICCAVDRGIPDSPQKGSTQVSCLDKHRSNDLSIISDLLGEILDVVMLSSNDSAQLTLSIHENKVESQNNSDESCSRTAEVIMVPAVVTTASEHQVLGVKSKNDLTTECAKDNITNAKSPLWHTGSSVSNLNCLQTFESLDPCDDYITNQADPKLLRNGATKSINPTDDDSTVQVRCLQKQKSKRKSNPSKCSDFTTKTLFLSQRFKQNRNSVLNNREIVKEWPGAKSATPPSPDTPHIDTLSKLESYCNSNDSDINLSKVLQNSSRQNSVEVANSNVMNSNCETSRLSHEASCTEFKDQSLSLPPQQVGSHSESDTVAAPNPASNSDCISLQRAQVKPLKTKIIGANVIPFNMIQSQADSVSSNQSQADSVNSSQSQADSGNCSQSQADCSQSQNDSVSSSQSQCESRGSSHSQDDSYLTNSSEPKQNESAARHNPSDISVDDSEYEEQSSSRPASDIAFGEATVNMCVDHISQTVCSDVLTSKSLLHGMKCNGLETSSTLDTDCFASKIPLHGSLDSTHDPLPSGSVCKVSSLKSSSMRTDLSDESNSKTTTATVDPLALSGISKASTSNINGFVSNRGPQTERSTQKIAVQIDGSALKMPPTSVSNSTDFQASNLSMESSRLPTDSWSEIQIKQSAVEKLKVVLSATSGNSRHDFDRSKTTAQNSSRTLHLDLNSDPPIKSQDETLLSELNPTPPIKTVDSSPSRCKKKDHINVNTEVQTPSNRRYSLRKKTSPLYTDFAIYTHSKSFFNRRRSNELRSQGKLRKRRICKSKRAVSKQSMNSASNSITVSPNGQYDTQMTKDTESETSSADECPHLNIPSTGRHDNKANSSFIQLPTKCLSSSAGICNGLSVSAPPPTSVATSSTGCVDNKLNGSVIQPLSTKGVSNAGMFSNTLSVSALCSEPAKTVPSSNAIAPIKKLHVSVVRSDCTRPSKCSVDKDITTRIPSVDRLDKISRKRHHQDASSNLLPNSNKRRNIHVVRLSRRVRKPPQKLQKEKIKPTVSQPHVKHTEGCLPQALVSIKRLVVPTEQISHKSPKKIKIAPVKTVPITSIPALKPIKIHDRPKILNNAIKSPPSKSVDSGIQANQPQDGVKNNSFSNSKSFTNHVLARRTNRQTKSLQDSSKMPIDASNSTLGGDSQHRRTNQLENISRVNFRYIPKLHDILSTVEPGVVTCCFCHLPANHVLGIGDLFGPYRPLAEEVLARQTSYNKHLDTPGLWDDVEPAYAADGSPTVSMFLEKFFQQRGTNLEIG